jgi:hypothetical protein
MMPTAVVALNFRIATVLTAHLASLTLLLMRTLVRVVSSLLDAVFAAPRRWICLRGLRVFARLSRLIISQKLLSTKG